MNVTLTDPYPRSLYVCYAFGYLTPFETMYLISLSRSLPANATVVNIGAGAGTSGLAFYEPHHPLSQDPWHNPPVPILLFTVDISAGGPDGGLENERNAFAAVGWQDHLPVQIQQDSKQAGKDWGIQPIDLVFVDGDHSLEGVRGDIKAWREHVKPGGLMVFHDYDQNNWPAVKQVVDELMVGWQPLPVVDHIIAFKKSYSENPIPGEPA